MTTRTVLLIGFIGLAGVSIAAVSTAQQRQTAIAAAQSNSRAELTDRMTQIQNDLTSLDRSHQTYREAAEKLGGFYSELSKKADVVFKASGTVSSGKADPAALANLQTAIKEMRQTQMNFNMQYLQLQEKMQNENRQYTTVSNILKTKHDTVKNSINNVR
jgi:DNA repair ATPase RecN